MSQKPAENTPRYWTSHLVCLMFHPYIPFLNSKPLQSMQSEHMHCLPNHSQKPPNCTWMSQKPAENSPVSSVSSNVENTWGPTQIGDSRSANSPEVVRNYWSPGNSPLCGITLLCVVQFEKKCMMWRSRLKRTLTVVRIVFLLVRHKRINILLEKHVLWYFTVVKLKISLLTPTV